MHGCRTKDTNILQSINENEFISETIINNKRTDGRNLLDYRYIDIKLNHNNNMETICEFKLKNGTHILVHINIDIVKPYINKPNEGIIKFSIDSSSIGLVNDNKALVSKLLKIIESTIKGSKCIDTEELVIISGHSVWYIHCNIHILEHKGNLIDSCCIAAVSALLYCKRPCIEIINGVPHISIIKQPNSLSLHHIPVTITVYLYSNINNNELPYMILDTTDKEEDIINGSISFTFNSYNELCCINKEDGIPITEEYLLKALHICSEKSKLLINTIKESIDNATTNDAIDKETKIRGKSFIDISDIYQYRSADNNQINILKDFNSIHKPVAFKGNDYKNDTTKSKFDKNVGLVKNCIDDTSVMEMDNTPKKNLIIQISDNDDDSDDDLALAIK